MLILVQMKIQFGLQLNKSHNFSALIAKKITRHINNITTEGELELNCNMRKTHFPNLDKPVSMYNIDIDELLKIR